jgi:uncharacterized protein
MGAMLFMQGVDPKRTEVAAAPATAANPQAAAPAAPAPTAAPPEPAATPLKTAPSFNCKFAAARAEKLICGDEELAALDRDLNRAYRQLDRVAGPLRQQIAAEQNGWRVGERDACSDAACVTDAMRQRITVLDSQRASLAAEPAE